LQEVRELAAEKVPGEIVVTRLVRCWNVKRVEDVDCLLSCIPTDLVRFWKSNVVQPDKQQLEIVANLLEFDRVKGKDPNQAFK